MNWIQAFVGRKMLRLIKGPRSCEFDLNHMTFPTPLTHRRRHIQRRDHHVLYQRRQESKMCPREDGLQGEGRWLEVWDHLEHMWTWYQRSYIDPRFQACLGATYTDPAEASSSDGCASNEGADQIRGGLRAATNTEARTLMASYDLR